MRSHHCLSPASFTLPVEDLFRGRPNRRSKILKRYPRIGTYLRARGRGRGVGPERVRHRRGRAGTGIAGNTAVPFLAMIHSVPSDDQRQHAQDQGSKSEADHGSYLSYQQDRRRRCLLHFLAERETSLFTM